MLNDGAKRWKRLDGHEGDVARESENKLGTVLDSIEDVGDHGDLHEENRYLPIPAFAKFHSECYARFCNLTMAHRVENRQHGKGETLRKGDGEEKEGKLTNIHCSPTILQSQYMIIHSMSFTCTSSFDRMTFVPIYFQLSCY